MNVGGYLRVSTLDEAVSAVADGAVVVAGGTDVMVKGRGSRAYAGRTLVDVGQVAQLHELRFGDSQVEIGAAVTLSKLVACSELRSALPLLADAAGHVGSVQTRNRATLAGNVANARPAADCIPALMVLGATVRVVGPDGGRDLPIAELFRATPACLRHEGMLVRTCYFADAVRSKLRLEPGELIRSVLVPFEDADERQLFYKLSKTGGVGLGLMNLALAGHVEDGVVRELRASMGGLFSRPCLLSDCVTPLVGTRADRTTLETCSSLLGEKIAAESPQLAGYAYKVRVAPALLADGIDALVRGTTLERGAR